MIVDFSVSNQYSFYKSVKFSMNARQDKNMEEYFVRKFNKERILTLSMIYGANASGKSNLLKAIEDLSTYATQKNTLLEHDYIEPFKFIEDSDSQATSFKIKFLANNIKFEYALQIKKRIIQYEKLEAYLTNQPSLIYERVYDFKNKNFDIATGYKIKLKKTEIIALQSLTNKFSTILSSVQYANIKNKYLYDAFQWFIDIDLIEKGDTEYPNFDYYSEFFNEHKKAKNFVLKLLEKVDLNVSDFYFKKVKDTYPLNKIIFIHNVNGKKIEFEEHEESEGTMSAFGLFCEFAEMIFGNYNIILIDEIEDSLHPNLLNYFINAFLFYTKNLNKQIIFTTHNINLLDEDFIRKDIVWFTEKQQNGQTDLYSLADFNIRKELSFVNAYKNGKFGAIPRFDIID